MNGEEIGLDTFRDVFAGPLDLGKLDKESVNSLCRYHNLTRRPFAFLSQRALAAHLKRLQVCTAPTALILSHSSKEDDKLIMAQSCGIDSLTAEELTEACEARGFCSDVDCDRLRALLSHWLHLSFSSPSLPPSLLLFVPCLQTASDEGRVGDY
jgi:hypothetical protein